MAISYVPELVTPPPRSAIKAAKEKYFNVDQTSNRSNSIGSIHDDPSAGDISTTSSFEEIQQVTGSDPTEKEFTEKTDVKHQFSMEFSDVVRAAVSAAAAKAVAATGARKTDVSPNAPTLSVNSVPKPPRQSLEFDKNDEELKSLLVNETTTPPPLPDSPVPKTDRVLEFAKSNVD